MQDGKLKLFPDVYGHESKIALGMEGKAHLIPKEKTPVRAEAIGSLAESTGTGGYAKKDLVHRVLEIIDHRRWILASNTISRSRCT